MTIIRPMLCTVGSLNESDLTKLAYPVYASPKLDGIRATSQAHNTGVSAYSRTGKLIPNLLIQAFFRALPAGLDGELIIGSPTDPLCYNTTQSGVMTINGNPDFTYYMFDTLNMNQPFEKRRTSIPQFLHPRLQLVHHTICLNPQDILDYYERHVELGFEGICLRPSIGYYKQGRAVISNQALFRMKPLETSEAKILEVHPLMHNTNPQTQSPLGYAERSSHQDNLLAQNIVGAFTVQDLETNVVFRIGTFKEIGMDLRAFWWHQREDLIGRVLTYSHFPIGALNKPRQPVFKGWRDKIDRG
jgi:DNA ligase-1